MMDKLCPSPAPGRLHLVVTSSSQRVNSATKNATEPSDLQRSTPNPLAASGLYGNSKGLAPPTLHMDPYSLAPQSEAQ